MMERYERALRTNMASAERDLKSNEDRRGFIIGAVLQLWETYHDKKQITEHSAPAFESCWLEWSTCLIAALQEHSEATDEHVLALAKSRVDSHKVGHAWNTIWMHQTEEGDEYSTITDETATVLPLVRDFLEDHPEHYTEVAFLENDPAYQAYLEAPL